ncbi:inosine-uridine preferring nucleoside hydrolase-like isoform X2 [Haliotis rufescens]|nr:inosine-uridine preferring nucleoside hydrolase-like isoform X2 [Haliotis rufescens]XP_046376261.2 inosine-uridine preferring nucleoside hydrolase-like isoform X2 [Haliotis rufescens]XP_046376262.2 inosine-uridine preferring nucleoside hydrolase-like isoform X2 [Haliotis rufescens]
MAADYLTRRKFIIDTDAGIDDAQAILMCLAASDVDVVALTTVKGNATATQVTSNLLRLLKAADRLEIPIYRGCEDMLLGWEKPDEYNYHGKDGFGDVPDPDPPSRDRVQAKHAVQALIDITKQYPGEITLIAIGPLTNVSMAVRMDQDLGSRLKACYIMGGNYRGEGNVTPSGEFNFYSDPEAAHIVLNSLGCPITLTCWELCEQYALTWEKYAELRKHNSKKCQFMKEVERLMVSTCKELNWTTYIPCDEVAAACAIDNKVITKSDHVYASVELHGHLTRGQMVVDWGMRLGKKPNVQIVKELDVERYMELLLHAIDVSSDK